MALGGAADLVADLVGHAVAGSAMEFGTQGRPLFIERNPAFVKSVTSFPYIVKSIW
jgi:hypothetical protein